MKDKKSLLDPVGNLNRGALMPILRPSNNIGNYLVRLTILYDCDGIMHEV